MKKLLLVILFSIQIVANDKLIMIFATEKGCGWCKRMKMETINYKPSLNEIKKKYILAKITKESGNMPHFLKPEFYPTTYILSSDGSKVLDTIIGYQSRKNFLNHISDLYEVASQKR
jgi:hypothetical protein